MSPKKTPLRTCIGCLLVRPKRELARVVCSNENAVSVDNTGKAHGRGAYICRIEEEVGAILGGMKRKDDKVITPNPDCVQKASDKKAFERAFRRKIKKIEIKDVQEKNH